VVQCGSLWDGNMSNYGHFHREGWKNDVAEIANAKKIKYANIRLPRI
jgi:hypothetical protein